MAAQPLHPGELVGIFVAVGGIAVGQIDAGHPHHLAVGLDEGLDIARRLVLDEAGQALGLDGHGMAGEDGDAVVALLPDDREVVAEVLELQPGEALGLAFDLLEQDDVRLGLAQPVEHEPDPAADRIDVPGRDADQVACGSNREGAAAAAGGAGVGIAHLEGGADEILDEVDLGAAQQVEEVWSTSSLTPSRSKTRSSSLRVSSKEKPYWKPEQPPPETARRSIRPGLPSAADERADSPRGGGGQADFSYRADLVHGSSGRRFPRSARRIPRTPSM